MGAEYVTDDQAIHAACVFASAAGEEIDDGTARAIAAQWAAGMGLGQSFATTGAIADPSDDTYRDLVSTAEYRAASAADRLALDMLGTYLLDKGPRGPQVGWSNVWVAK
jgi:hypothetical protein